MKVVSGPDRGMMNTLTTLNKFSEGEMEVRSCIKTSLIVREGDLGFVEEVDVVTLSLLYTGLVG